MGKLHRLGFNVPVVLLTGEAAPAHECLALDEGAIDVIFKSLGPGCSGQAPQRRGQNPACGSTAVRTLTKCGKLLLRPDISRACWKDVDVDGLTLGEYNIVHLLATNSGRYVPYRAIYDRLHYEGFIAGSGSDGYRCNVRAVIKRVRIKFGTCDSPRLRRDRKLPRLRLLLEGAKLTRCPCRELHPAVLMMKSAEDRPRGNVTEPLDRSNKRRILTQG